MIFAEFFSVDYIIWTVGGYKLSFIEFCGTFLGLWSFIEIVRRKVTGLVIALFSVIISAWFFYQLRLYSDMMLMIYYLAAALCAIVAWRRNTGCNEGKLRVARLPLRGALQLSIGIVTAVIALRFVSSHLHVWLPSLFPEPAIYAWADATTTVLGICASILLIRRKRECMLIWFFSDTISSVVYQKSGVYFYCGVYLIYVVCDAIGVFCWSKRSR